MALTISQYTDPGVYTAEVVVPGALNIATTPVLPTVIAHGSRVRQAINEAVTRGLVTNETLTVAGSAPHRATLAFRGDRKLANTTVYENGVALSDSFLSYVPASIQGLTAATFDLSVNNAFCIEMDGKTPVTMVLTDAAPSVTIAGTQINVTGVLGGAGTAAVSTAAEIVVLINSGLAGAAALGYGSAYSAVATVSPANTITITSPVTGPTSDVRVFAAQTTNASAVLFHASGVLDAVTMIDVSATVYTAGATYTADYIAQADRVDPLGQTGPQAILKVGDAAGVSNYVEDIDFDFVSDTLDWSNSPAPGVITQATLTSLTQNYAIITAVSDQIQVALDGRALVTVDLIGLGSPPLGYTSATSGAATAAEVAANVNAVLANNTAYGARYNGVATVVSNQVVLTSPTDGTPGSVQIASPTSLSGTSLIFGTTGTTVTGTGHRPALGAQYFVSYTYTRPTSDYANPKQFFTLDSALAFTGPIEASNALAIAAELAFRNGSPSVLLILVNDATAAGAPTTVEYQAALDAAANKSTATDIVVLSTNLAVQTALMQHVENQSGPVEKNYRRGWFGMPRSTAIGDIDTANTYVYRAARTLQVAADSPARGRLILVAPPGVEGISKTILKNDGTTETLDLDSTYLALAIASKMASFSSPATALARKTISGFDTADGDFTPWVRAERAQMASNGVTVVTFDAGRLILLDPTSTERAGGALISFEQISASTQKDNANRKITQALDAGVIGLVPVDLADFIVDIKLIISNAIEAEIGDGALAPYRDSSGSARPIDLNRDIQVVNDPNDPTKFLARWFYNLRYPALRIFGEWSVDNPLGPIL